MHVPTFHWGAGTPLFIKPRKTHRLSFRPQCDQRNTPPRAHRLWSRTHRRWPSAPSLRPQRRPAGPLAWAASYASVITVWRRFVAFVINFPAPRSILVCCCTRATYTNEWQRNRLRKRERLQRAYLSCVARVPSTSPSVYSIKCIQLACDVSLGQICILIIRIYFI